MLSYLLEETNIIDKDFAHQLGLQEDILVDGTDYVYKFFDKNNYYLEVIKGDNTNFTVYNNDNEFFELYVLDNNIVVDLLSAEAVSPVFLAEDFTKLAIATLWMTDIIQYFRGL